MKSIFALAFAIVMPFAACVADEESVVGDEQHSGNTGNNAGNNGGGQNTPTCSNTSSSPCYCIDDSSCPTNFYCQITDAAIPPYNGVCWPKQNNTPPPNGCNTPNCP